MKVNLHADIFNANWANWQDIAFIAIIILIAAFLLFIIIFAILRNSRAETDGRRMAKRILWYEQQIEAKRQTLEYEKAKSQAELEESRKELAEKETAAAAAESRTAVAREQLYIREQEIRRLLETVEMTKIELAEYQKREGTNVPEDIAINALTEKTLAESELAMIPGLYDCKIPSGINFNFTLKDITDYIAMKPKITVNEGVGQKPSNYKVEDKTFAFVTALSNGKMRMTFKCGPSYGAKLIKHLNQNVSAAKFPYGLIWFTVTNETGVCSLELVKQLLDISYKIARLGY